MSTGNSMKVVLIGDAASGKTEFVRRTIGADPRNAYVPTVGVEVRSVMHRGARYEFWDVAGNERLGGFREGYYVSADLAIVVSRHDSRRWIREFRAVCPHARVIRVRSIDELNLDMLL